MRRVVPALKEGGGYMLSSPTTRCPTRVSLEDFRRIVELGKKLGRY